MLNKFELEKEQMQKFLRNVNKNAFFMFGRSKDIYQAIYDYISRFSNYNERQQCEIKLINCLWKDKTKDITECFNGGEFAAIKVFLGTDGAKQFKKIWDRCGLCIYTTGYERRSYRSKKDTKLYINSNVHKLTSIIKLASEGFTLDGFLQGTFTTNYGDVISDIIALEIDEGNNTVLNRIRDIVYGDNNTALISREIIKGLLMSQSEASHKIVGDLLLAAKLQEGLRQVIVECMDEGSVEGFIYLLKIILDNNLERFSSVVRALDVWTALGIAAEKPAVIRKCLEIGYKALTDEAFSESCFESSDNLYLYMGLWSKAVREIQDTRNHLEKMLSSDKKYKKLTALYFLNQSQNTVMQYNMSNSNLQSNDLEVLAWVCKNICPGDTYSITHYDTPYYIFSNPDGAKILFNSLKRILNLMPKKEIIFEKSVFTWFNLKVTADSVLIKMMLAIGKTTDNEIVDVLIDYKDKMEVYTRSAFITKYLSNPSNLKQKMTLLNFLGDKGTSARKEAQEIVGKMNLLKEDYLLIEDLLLYKAGDLRKSSIKLLLKQTPDELFLTVERLISDKSEEKRLAGLDIVNCIEDNNRFTKINSKCLALVSNLSSKTVKEQVLADKLNNNDQSSYTSKNGYGLFNPEIEADIPSIDIKKGNFLKELLNTNEDRIKNILKAFDSILFQNRNQEYEVENYDGSIRKVILGSEYNLWSISPRNQNNGKLTLADYPLADIWRKFVEDNELSINIIIELDFLFLYLGNTHINDRIADWFEKMLDKFYPINKYKSIIKSMPGLNYTEHIRTILHALVNESPEYLKFELFKNISLEIYNEIPEDKFSLSYEKKIENNSYYRYSLSTCAIDFPLIKYWRDSMRMSIHDDQSFRDYFFTCYMYYRKAAYKSTSCLNLSDFSKAYGLGMIDNNEIYRELIARLTSPENIRQLTFNNRFTNNNPFSFPELERIRKSVTDRILEIELRRGDMTTEVSKLAMQIGTYKGIKHFVNILTGTGNDPFVRGYMYMFDGGTKKEMYSHLLKGCYPDEGDDARELSKLLKGKKITEKRLLEAAMYSPQWIDIIEEYLNWPGLKATCWYFHAHVNEMFNNDKETIIARYSPISKNSFKDGAFDIDWFWEAYKTIGEKRFMTVYDSAKYISEGGNHKRSQLFADAVLGKLNATELENVVSQKRNKDRLLAYSLVPLDKNSNDTLKRYEFIHQFIKESKQFGAQRRESEGKTATIALENLARNAGFSDVTRLIWNMETEKIEEIRPYLTPTEIDDITVYIDIDNVGKSNIKAVKDRKELKGIPTRFKENEYIKALKTINKSLKDQYSRARLSLEKAMESEDVFLISELEKLSNNPVIYPLIKNLIFKCNDVLGFYDKTGFKDLNGASSTFDGSQKALIAHPIHLYESGMWSDFQRYAFENALVQPFKQIFRELYRPNSDEFAEKVVSRRYAGHQIQPRKATALLKGRGWTASYEEGLQKVYFKEDIVAIIYSMADWFSPAEVEAPTLEQVRFTSRKTGEFLMLESVPKVIFPEVMRDVDLVVSVAHVGGVDPEASYSTIEMRTAIVNEMIRLMKIKNVNLKGAHAHITGMLGEYTVHLGSAVVHMQANGALNIIAVQSQHRGRIFLPFIDDDPKTAEVVSKILLLSEDKKIKDPLI